MVLLFEVYWRKAPVVAMAPTWIVKELDVVEDIRSCLVSSGIDFPTNPFAFEQLKETFCHGVIVAVSPTAHAGLQVVGAQKRLPVVTGELASLVRVHRYRLLRMATPHCHHQGGNRQVSIHSGLHGPAHNLSREQIKHDCQVEPALEGADISDVGDPR